MAESQPDTGDAPTTDQPAPDTGPETDWKAEAEKHQALSRKWEDRAKANATAAKELDKLRAQTMTEQEQAVAQARTEAETAAAAKYGSRLVDAEVKAAAAGRSVDIDALLEGLDRTRFLTDDGDPDVDEIKAWVDRIAPETTEPAQPGAPVVIDIGQGNRGPTPSSDDPLLAALSNVIGVSRG